MARAPSHCLDRTTHTTRSKQRTALHYRTDAIEMEHRGATDRTSHKGNGARDRRTTRNSKAHTPPRVLTKSELAAITAKQGHINGLVADLLATIHAIQREQRQERIAREKDRWRRVPPQSLESEKAVLACVLIDPARVYDVLAVLADIDFYGEANATIYRAIVSVAKSGATVDIVLVCEELKRRGLYGDVGGAVYLEDVLSTECVAANAVHHAGIVAGMARRRAAIAKAEREIERAYAGE